MSTKVEEIALDVKTPLVSAEAAANPNYGSVEQEERICAICLEALKENEATYKFCKDDRHAVHKEVWKKQGDNCPTCRAEELKCGRWVWEQVKKHWCCCSVISTIFICSLIACGFEDKCHNV